MWEIETEDFYEGIRVILKKTLTQAITPGITCQGEVVGMMKDEADRKIIEVFSQLHSV